MTTSVARSHRAVSCSARVVKVYSLNLNSNTKPTEATTNTDNSIKTREKKWPVMFLTKNMQYHCKHSEYNF